MMGRSMVSVEQLIMVLSMETGGSNCNDTSELLLAVSYTHLRAHETGRNPLCRLLLEEKKSKIYRVGAWLLDVI